MWSYNYKHGDQPLEGYTIQRPVGRGGFGEVYYALSDTGREVALKAIQGYEQIEVRGTGQCMNLKSPHLVTIFDIKYNAEGRPFVIMEFVAGPSLRQLIDESPAGLGEQKAAFFLREIAKGLTYLHDCGIVHRDLKPANIFFENGYVKIGDYGLSKALAPMAHSGQTITVGTVHYMAPEIGAGKYDRSIDIYAMGALLYEMLTGTVPFIGASPTEILLKHISAEPDVRGISEPFASVIRRAMAKNPAQRYQSVQEMVEAVFGEEHVRQSMSVFAPADLSMVAGRVAAKMPVGVAAGVGSSTRPPPLPVRGHADSDVWNRANQSGNRAGDRIADTGNRMAQLGLDVAGTAGTVAAATGDAPAVDSVDRRQRRMLGLITAAVVAIAAGLLTPERTGDPWPLTAMAFVFLAIIGASWGLMLGHHRLVANLEPGSELASRLAAGGMAAILALMLSLVVWLPAVELLGPTASHTWLAILAPLFVMNTRQWCDPHRKRRINFWETAFLAALFGFGINWLTKGNPYLVVAVLGGTSLAVQIVSPWLPRGNTQQKQPTGQWKPQAGDDSAPVVYGHAMMTVDQAADFHRRGGKVFGQLEIVDAMGRPVPNQSGSEPRYWWRPVPGWVRLVCAMAAALLLPTSIALLVAAASMPHMDMVVLACTGIGVLLLFFVCAVRALTTRFYGWWSYLIRPLLFVLPAVTLLTSAAVLSNMRHPSDESRIIGTFFIVFPLVLMLVLLFIPGRTRLKRDAASFGAMAIEVSPHHRSTAALLTLLLLVGAGGIQRFYVGKIWSGLLWFFTGGLLGIGQLVDLIMILTGSFRDSRGRALKHWAAEDRAWRGSAAAPPATEAERMVRP